MVLTHRSFSGGGGEGVFPVAHPFTHVRHSIGMAAVLAANAAEAKLAGLFIAISAMAAADCA